MPSQTAVYFPERWPEFAQLAVELKLIERDVCFRELSFAMGLSAALAGMDWRRFAIDAHAIGMAPDAIQRIMVEWTERARLLAGAHDIFKALIPHQPLIFDLVKTTLKK